jgi:UDP-3-O-acyl-N-acetylglucosamine deacetylase
VPGQDLSRQVIAVHDGRAYKLVFMPADEAQGDVYHEMEAPYELAVRSFRFLPRQPTE